ncbi:MAG: hypothetical protein AB9891_10740 [Anaerolineaceae bacterium]
MKTTSRFLLLLSVLVILLSGCASLTGQAGTAGQTSGLSSDLTLSTKTGLGILELEGQTLAVDADQARTLLPLWQALQTLSSDSNTTPDEITSLNDQIEETLTTEQLSAIDGMSWNEEDLSSLVQKYAATTGQTGSSDSSAAAAAFSPDGAAMGAGMTGGAPMEGGGGDMAAMGVTGTTASTTTSHTTIAGQEDRESAGGMNLIFAPAVIELLQSKITLA